MSIIFCIICTIVSATYAIAVVAEVIGEDRVQAREKKYYEIERQIWEKGDF